MRFTRLTVSKIALAATMVSLLLLGVRPLVFHSYADKLPDRSLLVTDPTEGVTTSYKFDFTIPSVNTVGSIRFQFCSDTPLIDQPCQVPDGFNISGAELVSQLGESGFIKNAATVDNEAVISRAPVAVTPGAASFTFKDVVNPSAEGSYYVRIQTYASTDATGPWIDAAGLAYVINGPIDISTYVPPYLLFCGGVTIDGYDCATSSGNYVNFGELSNVTTKSATTQMVVATNAPDGYNIWLSGSTLASNMDVIPAITTQDVSRPGTGQFGINLTANTTPNKGQAVEGPGLGTVTAGYDAADKFRFVDGDLLATANSASDFRKYTVSYIVNIAKGQPAGLYVSTVSYVCLANF